MFDFFLVFMKPLLYLFSSVGGDISIQQYLCIMKGEHSLNHSMHLDLDNSLIFLGSHSKCIAIMEPIVSLSSCLFLLLSDHHHHTVCNSHYNFNADFYLSRQRPIWIKKPTQKSIFLFWFSLVHCLEIVFFLLTSLTFFLLQTFLGDNLQHTFR